MMNPSGLYSQSVLEVWLPGQLSIEDAVPPSEVQHRNVASYPEAVRVATLRLNRLVAGLRAETGRTDIPEVVPSNLTQLAYRAIDAGGHVSREVPSLNLELLRVRSGPPQLADEIDVVPREIAPPSFARELLDSAKFHVITYNARRAILDVAGAFEAWVADVVTPKLGDVAVNTKKQFLRTYGPKLSAAARQEAEQLSVSPEQDPPRMPSVQRQLRDYQKAGHQPNIDPRLISRIQKVMNVRNDAAHGRPISPTVLHDLVPAIDALDELLRG